MNKTTYTQIVLKHFKNRTISSNPYNNSANRSNKADKDYEKFFVRNESGLVDDLR